MEWLFIFYNSMDDKELLSYVKEAMNKLKFDASSEIIEQDSGYRALSCRYFNVSWFAGEKIMQDFAAELHEKYNALFDSELYIQLMVNDKINSHIFNEVILNTKQFVMTFASLLNSNYIFMNIEGDIYYKRVNGETVNYCLI